MTLSWVLPSLASSLALLGVYGYLAARYRERFLISWSVAWGWYALRFACLLPAGLGRGAPLWTVLNQLAALWSAYFLLRGARQYQGRHTSRGWLWALGAGSLWVAGAHGGSVPFLWYTLPTFFLLGLANLDVGRVLWRGAAAEPAGRGAQKLAALAFAAWGLHKLDYPFLRPVEGFAPWGYGLGAILGLGASLLLLVAYLERERARARHAQRFLRAVLDTVPDPVLVVGPDFQVLDANRAAGVDPPPVPAGTTCHALSHGRDTPCAEQGEECPLAAVRATGQPASVTHAHRDANGRRHHVEIAAAPLRDEAGGVQGIVEICRDVTARVGAAEALARAKDEWEATFDAVPELIALLDPDGRVRRLNRAMAQRLGLEPPDLVGRPCGALGLGDAADLCRRGSPSRFEVTSEALGGTFLVTLTPVGAPGDREAPQVLVARDVTAERQLEWERVRNQHLEALGIFAGGIAHDFNNLLMGISGNVELAGSRLARSPGRAAEPLDRALRACERASGIAKQLLTFARGGEPVPRPLDLGEVLDEWVRFPLHGSPVTAQVELAPDLPPVRVDHEQIHQVVTNLVVNARQAMPRGGTVRVRADVRRIGAPGVPESLSPGRYLAVTVADEGHGIAPEHLPRIFDPYFTTKETGSGLGLATSFSIIRRHGGTIQAASREGEGAVFTVYLPVARDSAAPAAAEGQASAPSVRGRRILAMDDEDAVREILGETLAALGCRVDLACRGEEALARYREAVETGCPYDAVLLDLTVSGGMGGVETARRILEIDPGARLVATSGYSQDAAIARPGEFGFRASLAKPFSLAALAATVAEVVAGGSEG
ncbi:MAG: hypothetical protein Kow0092_03340 [Deferrisomatales bacterium]